MRAQIPQLRHGDGAFAVRVIVEPCDDRVMDLREGRIGDHAHEIVEGLRVLRPVHRPVVFRARLQMKRYRKRHPHDGGMRNDEVIELQPSIDFLVPRRMRTQARLLDGKPHRQGLFRFRRVAAHHVGECLFQFTALRGGQALRVQILIRRRLLEPSLDARIRKL
ncbi:hypothetical protein ACFSUI_11220 [Ralstonia solanacearum]